MTNAQIDRLRKSLKEDTREITKKRPSQNSKTILGTLVSAGIYTAKGNLRKAYK